MSRSFLMETVFSDGQINQVEEEEDDAKLEETHEDDSLSHHLLNLMAELNRKQEIVNKISRECTEANIRKRYNEMDIKEITYDPGLYSVVATESLGIHRRLLKMFGTDVIRLQDPKFIENSLQIMLDDEEKQEKEATAARMKRGELCEWNAKKKSMFGKEVEKMLQISSSTYDTSRQAIPSFSKTKKKTLHNLGVPIAYDHSQHEFEIPDSKYDVNDTIWDDEDDKSLCAENVSLLFEHAEDVIVGSHLSENDLKMKRCGYDLDVSPVVAKTDEISKKKDKKQENKNNSIGMNNSSKVRLRKEKCRKSILTSSDQQLFHARTSSFSRKYQKSSKAKPKKVVIREMDEDDRSAYQPLTVKPEEKKIEKPSLHNQS